MKGALLPPAFFLRAGDLARAAGLRAGLAARFGAGERERRVATILQRLRRLRDLKKFLQLLGILPYECLSSRLRTARLEHWIAVC